MTIIVAKIIDFMPTQAAVAEKILNDYPDLFYGAEEAAIRRIFQSNALPVCWQKTFCQLGLISAQFLVKEMTLFRKLRNQLTFRTPGLNQFYDPAKPFDISLEEQQLVEETDFADMLKQGQLNIGIAGETAVDNPMDALPTNIAKYTVY